LNKTPKTEIIAIELAKGSTDGEAYGKAFSCTKASANSQAGQYIAEHNLRQRAIDIIEQTAGLTLKDALQGVKEGLQATYEDKQGKVHKDYVARHEYIKTLLRLHNELGDGQTKTQTLNQTNINIVNAIPIDTLRQLINEVKHMRLHKNDIMDGEVVRESPNVASESASDTKGEGVYG
jgi:hypothetical protein